MENIKKVNQRRPGYFRFNDIEMDIPPQNITITHTEYDNSYFLLRESAPTVKKSGLKKIRINVSLTFDTNEDAQWTTPSGQFNEDLLKELSTSKGKSRGWNDLSKMIIQIRKYPVATLENEKIRNELLQGYIALSDDNANTSQKENRFKQPVKKNSEDLMTIATIVDGLQFEVDEENPSLIRVMLSMTYFNYLPYSYNLMYARYSTSKGINRIRPSHLPTKDYVDFYKSKTTINGNLINNPNQLPDLDSNDMHIFYKDYLIFGSPEHHEIIPEDKGVDLLDIKKESKAKKSRTSKLEQADPYNVSQKKFMETTSFRKGWVLASSGTVNRNQDLIIYKWKRFTIPAMRSVNEGGGLILQNMSASLQTNVSYIPMEKYPIPTAQFMGGSMATLRTIIYAPPEYRSSKTGTTQIPMETSNRLGKLQTLFDQVNYNRTKFAKYAKDDYILIRHPLSVLLKYEPYIPKEGEYQKIAFEDHENPLINGTIDMNECFSCVLSNRVSTTIEGVPFASQFQADFKEQKINQAVRSIQPLIGNDKENNRNTVKGAIKQVFENLFKRYNCSIELNQGIDDSSKTIIPYRPVNNTQEPYGIVKIGKINKSAPDYKFMAMIKELMDSSLYARSYKSISEMIDDEELFNGNNKKFIEVATSSRNLEIQNQFVDMGKTYRTRTVGPAVEFKRMMKNKKHLNYDNLGPILTRLIKAVDTSNYPWANGYKKAIEKLVNIERLPQISTYPDLLLPTEFDSPTFFFFEDGYLQNRMLEKIGNIASKGAIDTEKVLLPLLHSAPVEGTEDQEVLGINRFFKAMKEPYNEGDIKKALVPNNVPPASNINTDKPDDAENAKTSAAVHVSHLPADRMQLVQEASFGLEGLHKGMSRSAPAYKIFVMEDNDLFSKDISREKLENNQSQNLLDYYRDISEFFDLSNVVDIRLSKKEDNPADLLVIRVAGSKGDKVNSVDKGLSHEDLMRSVRKTKTFKELTKMEQMFAEKGLREGTRIQLRLGYDSDPNNLNTEFNGKIVSVSGSDIIEIVCAGNGLELVQDIKAPTKKDTYNYHSNTRQLIRDLLKNSSELTSFGTLAPKAFGFEMTFLPGFTGGRTITDNIFAPDLFPSLLPNSDSGYFTKEGAAEWTESSLNLGLKTFSVASTLLSVGGVLVRQSPLVQAGLRKAAQTAAAQILKEVGKKIAVRTLGQSIARGAGVVAGGILGSTVGFAVSIALIVPLAISAYKVVNTSLFGTEFSIYQMTIWEVLQELTLRHPGAICAVVPYGNRSTIYFGEPHQFYFHRPPTAQEIGWIPSNYNESSFYQASPTKTEQLQNMSGISRVEKSNSSILTSSKERESYRNLKINKIQNKTLGDKELSAICKTPFRKYHYVTSEKDIIKNNIQITSRGVYNSVQVAYPTDSDDANFDGTVGYSDYDITAKMQADDNIYPEYIKNRVYTFHNAHNETVKDLPERYAKSLLVKNIEKTYDGKLIILGRPNIKPHDVVIVYDTYNNIVGPVGVREMVHIISPTRGWITEIKPKLMVFPDNSSGAMQLSLLKKITHFIGISDQELFYTNIKRFMPTDYGAGYFPGIAADASRAIDMVLNEMSGAEDQVDKYQIEDAKHLIDEHNQKFSNHPVASSAARNAAVAGASLATKEIIFGTGVIDNGVSSIKNTTLHMFDFYKDTLKEFSAGRETIAKSIAKNPKLIKRMGDRNNLKFVKNMVKATRGNIVGVGTKTIGVAWKIFSTISWATGGLALNFALDSVIEGIISYVKYRQPIIFHPLTRNGEPWYGGMRGYKDNTIVESITEDIQEWKNVSEYSWAVMDRYLRRIMGD